MTALGAQEDGLDHRRAGGRPRSTRARHAILDATLAVLHEAGLANLTIEGVAAKAGVGKATIYRWWPSRTSLVLEAMEELPELPVPDTGSLAGDLRVILTELANLLRATPLQSVLARLVADGLSGAEPEVRDYLQRRTAVIADVFSRAVARGELAPGQNVEDLIYLAMGPVLNRSFFGAGPPDADFIELVVQTLTTGWRPPKRRSRKG